jgi:uncharacterized protein YjbI with pentapeptide repeats
VWIGLFVLVLYFLGRLVTNTPELSDFAATPDQAQQSLNEATRWHILAFVGLLTALGGLITLPIALIRVMTTERQVTAAEQGLITDRINKAVEGLGADKVVKRQRVNSNGKKVFAKTDEGTPDLTRPIWDEITEPNLEVRIGAIFSLERISQDSPRDHIQIMEILCAYIVQNSDRSDVEMPENEEELTPEQWEKWATSFLQKPRSDIETILSVLSRRSKHLRALEKAAGFQLKLEEVDLRCLRLPALDLRGANLFGAMFAGAIIPSAKFNEANLHRAQFQAATLKDSEFTLADLRFAQMHSAILWGTTNFQEASFFRTKLPNSDLGQADLKLAQLILTDLQETFVKHIDLRGAYLVGVTFSERAGLDTVEFRGSGIRNIDLSLLSLTQDQLDEMFGDSSVTVPKGRSRPTHWPPEDAKPLSETDFKAQWRAWQKSIGFDPEDPSTWDAPKKDHP